jgi:hypothetical protein
MKEKEGKIQKGKSKELKSTKEAREEKRKDGKRK